MIVNSSDPPALSPIAPRDLSPLDELRENLPDTTVTIADDLAKRAELELVEQQVRAQQRETHLDALRISFDATQKEHAELLREMNALRDMATEQMKQDDANLKKWIALI